MGGGASTSNPESMRSVLINADAMRMSKGMSRDESMRQSFANFVKSGAWLDFLAHYFPSDKPFLTSEDRLVRETGNLVYAYKLPKTKTVCLRGIIFDDAKSTSSKYEEVLSNKSAVTSFYSDEEGVGFDGAAAHFESYADIEECSIFPAEDFLDILLNVLYPIFIWSGFYARFLKNGPEEGYAELDEDSFLAGPPSNNKLAVRAQELLLGSAAYFDQSIVVDHLRHPEWATSIPRVMDGLSLCVTLLDASLPEPHFVYANKAFTNMYGYTAADVVGKSLVEVMAGEETDGDHSEQIALAMKSEVLSKYAIAHYTKSGKAFIDMISIKNCGKYTILVHLPATTHMKMADLKSVDDAIVLLTCLLTPPPVAHISTKTMAPVPSTSAKPTTTSGSSAGKATGSGAGAASGASGKTSAPGLLSKLAFPMLKAGRKTLSGLSGMGNGAHCNALATDASNKSSNSSGKSIPQGDASNKGYGSKFGKYPTDASVTSMDTYGYYSSSSSTVGRPVVPMLDFSMIHYE